MCEQGLQLGAENQSLRGLGIVERLDANPVARQQQALPPRIPDGEGKHPAKTLHAAWPHVFVQMHDYFGVAGGAKTMTSGLEVLAQSAIVVNFAVEDDP